VTTNSEIVYYFGYGSNNPAQMGERIGKPLFKQGIGILNGYAFTYQGRSDKWHCGTANVSPSSGQRVFGILYSGMEEDDFNVLDNFEAVATDPLGNDVGRYRREKVNVYFESEDRVVEAVCYVMTGHKPIDRQLYPPSNRYLNACLETAHTAGFPLSYILTSIIPEHVSDPKPAPGYSLRDL